MPPQQRTALARLLFPEFELKNETEDVKEEKGDEDEAAGKEEEEEELRKYAALANGLAMQTLGSAEDFPELLQDKPFLRFQRRVSHYPEQVIRYGRQWYDLFVDPPCVLKHTDTHNLPTLRLCGSVRRDKPPRPTFRHVLSAGPREPSNFRLCRSCCTT